jgi:hypothetical protein
MYPNTAKKKNYTSAIPLAFNPALTTLISTREAYKGSSDTAAQETQFYSMSNMCHLIVVPR